MIFDKNMELLRKRYVEIYREIENVKPDSNAYQLIKTPNGRKTLKVTQAMYGENKSFFLHSKYDPDVEALKFVKEQYDPRYRNHVLYGFGLGYHVFELAKLLGTTGKLYVIENNVDIFRIALEEVDLEPLLSNTNVELIISRDVSYLAESIKTILCDRINFIIHPASMKAIPNENEYFKFIIENWNLKKSITDDYNNLLRSNLDENLKNRSINTGVFFNKFSGIPIIIVSTGPSLDKNIDFLHDVKGKALIISAGSALRPLMLRGIEPDFFVIIDPQTATNNQIKGYEDANIPFIYLATAASCTVNDYKGIKLIACQEKDYLEDKDKAEYLVDTGGSVSTTALDIAIKMGGSPIILIGQDLAFINGKNHAEHGTHININSPSLKNMRKVLGQNGEVLDTSLGFLSFKYWIENRIAKEDRLFINATEGGAYIEGMRHMTLKEVIDEYLKCSFDAGTIIENTLKESGYKYV